MTREPERRVAALQEAVRRRLGVEVELVGSRPVELKAQAERVHELEVYELRGVGTSQAPRYFAWTQRFDGETEPRTVVVSASTALDSPRAAVDWFLARQVRGGVAGLVGPQVPHGGPSD